MNKMLSQAERNFRRLLNIIEKLRSKNGCLWDKKQKKEDISKYLLEESYELIDAIESGSPKAIKEEMGDLLFQILFLARISEEAGEFNISGVMEHVAEKMIRRHPHVFGNTKVKNIEEIKANWEDIKKHREKRNENSDGLLDRIPRSLPSLLRAQKITEKVVRNGFDCRKREEVLDKIEEGIRDIKSSLKTNKIHYIGKEIGEILFSLVILSLLEDVNAEEALKASTAKFTGKFSYIEKKLTDEGRDFTDLSPKEINDLWNETKLKV